MWRALLAVAAHDARLDGVQLTSLLDRAGSFAEELEGYRLRAVEQSLAAG